MSFRHSYRDLCTDYSPLPSDALHLLKSMEEFILDSINKDGFQGINYTKFFINEIPEKQKEILNAWLLKDPTKQANIASISRSGYVIKF